MPNSYSRRNRSNNSTLALLSKPPLAPAPQVEGRLVTPGGVGQLSPAQGGHHSIAKPDVDVGVLRDVVDDEREVDRPGDRLVVPAHAVHARPLEIGRQD